MRKISKPNLKKIMRYLLKEGSTDVIRDTAKIIGASEEDVQKWKIDAQGFRTKKYVVTCAQNCSPVNKEFLKSIHRYCREHEAELIVLPFNYNSTKAERWFDPSIEFFIDRERRTLTKNLIVMTDITRTPTVKNPLASRETITGEMSGIFPHSRVAFKTVPTPQHRLPKIITTTGILTEPRYTDTSAGKMGEFHHTFGAVTVTTKGDKFHLRQLLPDDDGSFYDLDQYYSPTSMTTDNRIEALILGDSHVQFFDELVRKATFDSNTSMTKLLQPHKVIHHDLLDQYTRNHHHKGNSVVAWAKAKAGIRYVQQEVDEAIQFLNETTPENSEAFVVASNHNDALTRWLLESDFREDPDNAGFFLEMNLAMYNNTFMGPTGPKTIDPFAYYASGKTDAKFLKRDQSFMVKDIELGYHGDKGLNGARGSAMSFTKIGPKCIIGHSHSPQILEGVYQTGCSNRYNLDYTTGPSSWLQTHCIIYPNGKRSLINIIEGKWF